MSRRRSTSRSTSRNLAVGLAFLAPNILGVLLFTVFPVVFSLLMAFTNWDLTQQNMFKPEADVRFVGLDNVTELLTEDRVGEPDPGGAAGDTIGLLEAFWSARFTRYLGNTLFFMMAIPFAVGGSLLAAIALSQDTRAGGGRNWAVLGIGGVLLSACVMLAALGLGASAMTLLILGAGCGVLLCGLTGGLTFYRTLFYTPHFVAGVATFVLWKKLFNAQTGPINRALEPVLDGLAAGVSAAPAAATAAAWTGLGPIATLTWALMRRLLRMRLEGDLGVAAVSIGAFFVLLPVWAGHGWIDRPALSLAYPILIAAAAVLSGVGLDWRQRFPSPSRTTGLGTGLVLSLFGMVGIFVLLGLTLVAADLPALAADGLDPPAWLRDVQWAKPALMLMGLWAAIGSGNMLLYLAALTNVAPSLYEAADLDGAGPLQKFWHVTWPQLAPTTFFIFVMSTIAGLQGGFEAARVMTQGGPAGATTTLSYFIYEEGFVTGRLGFASAIAWTLFLIVLAITLFNWKFGEAYVED